MAKRRTQEPFGEELRRLLAERQTSQRALAQAVGVNQSYLTFVLQRRRAPSRRLLQGAAAALGLEPDYFREYREQVVIDAVRQDPALLDRAYALVTRSRS